MIEFLVNPQGHVNTSLFSTIWKGFYTKKIKVFLWKLNHGGINTADCLKRRIHFYLSPSWCFTCKMLVLKDVEKLLKEEEATESHPLFPV